MEIEARERLIRDAVLGLTPDVRRALLHVIVASEADRAEAVQSLWAERPGDGMAEVLIDLEEDRALALEVADAIKDSLHDFAEGVAMGSPELGHVPKVRVDQVPEQSSWQQLIGNAGFPTRDISQGTCSCGWRGPRKRSRADAVEDLRAHLHSVGAD